MTELDPTAAVPPNPLVNGSWVGTGRPGPGRPKGSHNSAISATRQALAHLAELHLDDFSAAFRKVCADDPAEACELYLKLCTAQLPRAPTNLQIPLPDGGGERSAVALKFEALIGSAPSPAFSPGQTIEGESP